MRNVSLIFSLWQRLADWPGGKWLFSKLLCWKAPYFGSISPRFKALRPGYCEITMRKRRAVLNHIGTVHAIAMCNVAELAAGTMTDVSIPVTHRWIPRSMHVEYLKKAETDLRAVAEWAPIPVFEDTHDQPVTVNVLDAHDKVVFRATITMKISPKKGE